MTMSSGSDFLELIGAFEPLSESVKTNISWTATSYEYYEWHIKNDSQHSFVGLPDNIKRIRFICPKGRVKPGASPEGMLDITYKDGNKIVLLVPPDKFKAVSKFLLSIEAKYWEMLEDIVQEKLDWTKFTQHYGGKGFKDYQIIHQRILDKLTKQITQLLQTDTELASINLLDAGCGQTPGFLIKAYDITKKIVEASQRDVKVNASGFDFEDKNIEMCNATIHSEVKFEQGDLNDIEEIIKHRQSSPNSCNVVLSSGTITRCVLNNSFEAVNVLQHAWRGPAHQLILGGERELLFVRRMLNKIGYDIDTHQTFPPLYQRSFGARSAFSPLVSIVRITEDQMTENFINRLEGKPTILNLSLNPFPEKLLTNIVDQATNLVSKVEKIDLSFSLITDHMQLINVLNKFPALKEVTLTHFDPKLISEFTKHSHALTRTNLKISINETHKELELVGSKNFIERTGLNNENKPKQ